MRKHVVICLGLFACSNSDNPAKPDAAPIVPVEVSNLEAFDVRATELSLRWTPGSDDSGRYWIAYAKGGTAPATCAPTVDIKASSTTISGLDANTPYSFRLCPVDDRGGTLTIAPGITATASTLQVPPGDPSNLALVQTGPGAFTASWTSAQGAAGYVVAYAEGTVAPANCFASSVVHTSSLSAQLTSLPANKRYAVRVCAKNGNPTPDLSAGVTKVAFMNSPLAPDPTSVLAATLDAEWLRLTWSGSSIDYKIAIGTSAPDAKCPTASDATTRTSLVFTNLAPSTSYFIRVCPSNGDSEPLYSNGTLLSVTTRARAEPRVNGLHCAGNKPALRWTGSAQGGAFFYTNVEFANATTPPLCTLQNTSLLQTSVINNEHSTEAYGSQPGHMYWMRVCFRDFSGTFDQGQATVLTVGSVNGGVVFPGSCSAQETLERPVMTMSATSAVVQDVVGLAGTCTVPGSVVQIGGDATGTATCTNNQWATTANVTTLGDGPIRIAASAYNDGRFQSVAAFVTVTKMCESSTTTCGDGVVDTGEECDLGCGNGNDRACTATCMNAICGDGFVGPGEQCDEGMANSNTGSCTLACQRPRCGDGYTGPQEECDLGLGNGSDAACTPVCRTQRCGDGYHGAQEPCDDGMGNYAVDGTCTPECKPQICGDGYRGAGEECDAGAENAVGAFCLPDCTRSCDDDCVDADAMHGRLSAGMAHNCAIHGDGTIGCAGYDEYSEGTPSGAFTAVTAREGYTCGLRASGAAVCWGKHLGVPSAPTVPAGSLYTRIDTNCGVTTAGGLECWGSTVALPAGVFSELSVSRGQGGCALRDDLRVVCWGNAPMPPLAAGTTFKAVSYGGYEACALRTNNSLVCWSPDGITLEQPGPFLQMGRGRAHVCVRDGNNAIACFGSNTDGQATPPAGTYLAVDAFDDHTCGIRSDGVVRCWGTYASEPAGNYLP